LPTKDIVNITRDVVFAPTLFYNKIERYALKSIIKEVIKLLKYLEMP
jgi:hypothetical protein